MTDLILDIDTPETPNFTKSPPYYIIFHGGYTVVGVMGKIVHENKPPLIGWLGRYDFLLSPNRLHEGWLASFYGHSYGGDILTKYYKTVADCLKDNPMFWSKYLRCKFTDLKPFISMENVYNEWREIRNGAGYNL